MRGALIVRSRRRLPVDRAPVGVGRLLILAVCLALAGCGLRGPADGSPESSAVASAPMIEVVPPAGSLDAPAGMATIALGALPREARETLSLIAANGPFPYRQDGAVFENRERLLPGRPTGHYREFTVVTPGEGDRGARRIVTGADGERYWTDDHYDSFRWIVP